MVNIKANLQRTIEDNNQNTDNNGTETEKSGTEPSGSRTVGTEPVEGTVREGSSEGESTLQGEEPNKQSTGVGDTQRQEVQRQAESNASGNAESGEGLRLPEGAQGIDEIKPIGKGVFGNIYDQFKGKVKEAIAFLRKIKSGEALDVLHHKEVDGDISLIWGNDKYGLAKIENKHPEVLDDLQGILNEMHVIKQSDNRIILESDAHKAIISKKKGEENTKNWLLTAYEKKEKSVSASSSDIETEPEGKRNGTATPQSGLSKSKDTKKSETPNISEEKSSKEEDIFKKAERIAEETKVNTNPTEAQKEAGNYKKGHIKLDGYDVTIENPKGSVRSGKDSDGEEWHTTMHKKKSNNPDGLLKKSTPLRPRRLRAILLFLTAKIQKIRNSKYFREKFF